MELVVISGMQIFNLLQKNMTNEVIILNSNLEPARKYKCTSKYSSSLIYNWHSEIGNYYAWSGIIINEDAVITFHYSLGGLPDGATSNRVIGNAFYCREKDLIILETEVIGDDAKWHRPHLSFDDEQMLDFVKHKMVIQLIK
ncbi:hypothetical protein [Pseudomonas rhodesiae]|uniref:hypothetical protein n=1 Tax=Pseudomonas rhodesiae TaxID=76760 RepID=UPI0024DFD38E|nr:hypothetical protein [Pseudomonas rhodesiae]WHT80213.1 hypothetical protein QMY54_05032 [Pseudomonas rhodesiae]